MSGTRVRDEAAIEIPTARTVDMKLEVLVIPVSDVDRAAEFYSRLGQISPVEFERRYSALAKCP